MEVTRIIYEKPDTGRGVACPVAQCSIIFDDVLKCSGIRLYKKQEDSSYYLVFPSKQDIYQEIKELNKDVELIFPIVSCKVPNLKRKKYEEFFNPVSSEYYEKLLDLVVKGYDIWIESNKKIHSYRPKV